MTRTRGVRAALLLAVALHGCAATPPLSGTSEDRVCFECFWEHQTDELRADLVATYSGREYSDPLADAERQLILGRVTRDRDLVCNAYRLFRDAQEGDAGRRLLAAESAAFLATGCGGDASRAFRRASREAATAGDEFKARVYADVSEGGFRPRFARQRTRSRPVGSPPPGTHSYILGASSIVVRPGDTIAVQAERTVRDWLSYQLDDDLLDRVVDASGLLDWHEGALLRELMQAVHVAVSPVRGVIVARRGERWFAADDEGRFRFEVLPDKLQYAATRVHGSLALLMDTHGISALERDAVRMGASLVVGCGDHPAKMLAAYRLARRGVPVWFPTDRFAGDVLGYEADAALLGSAPVRRTAGGAIIGDTPVAFRLSEKVIVQDADGDGPARYYDAAARYFRQLSRHVKLDLEFQRVDGPGLSSMVVELARAKSANAIALRVATESDAGPVRLWLKASNRHRAVLFHTVAYPAGAALFKDFPGQVTFGDPRPTWIGGTQVSSLP